MSIAPVAVTLYTVVLAVHIAFVMIAFGITFTYALIDSFVRRVEPRWMPAVHRIQEHVGKRIVSGGMVVVLVAGIYLASKLHVWSDFYVQWGIGVVVVLGAMSGMFFAPREARL